jgi:ABC-2 type transport system permease protein
MPMTINIETKMLYNPQLVGAYMFVPGVIALILMLICTMMTSVALVREKELGTMEVILVSPLKKLMFIVAKAVPYLVLSLMIVGMILLLSYFVLDVPIRGNLLLLLMESALFILLCLSLGLLISSLTGSQQVAMLISLIGLMLPTIMLSGFMFPIENMPKILQVISHIVPARWFFIIIKSIMIKGMGILDLLKETAILMGFTLVLISVSIAKFKERLL